MVAAVGAFGAGAYALSQGGSSFDPSAFISAYDQGGQDKQKGYQANRTETDAQANRADDGDDRDAGTDADNATDTPAVSQANVPAAGASGTTAVRVTGDGSGTGVNVAGGSGSGKGGTVVSGPVIPGSGGTGTPGAGGNPDSGGGNGGAGGNNQGGNNQGGAATDPTQNSYRVLPQDPVADEKKLTGFADDTVNSSNEAISKLDEADVEVMISGRTAESNNSDNDLYVGQKLDAWTVFLALDASYHPRNEFKFYQWSCKKDDFASYPYFKVLEFPSVVPDRTFDIKIAYRINDRDSWHELTVSYLPAQTCTFIVGSNAERGQQVYKSYNNPLNLYTMTQQLMSQLGYCEASGDNLTHLLLGWKEGDTEVSGPLYTPEPGRHVLEPSEIVKIPGGCSASIESEYVGGDLGTVSYQTLSGVESDSAVISTSAGGKRTLTVPEGFQKVSFDEDCEVDDLSIPSSVLSVDAAGSKLRVKRAYKVDKDNALYATTADGVLTDKAGTEYYGIPTSMKKLVVPAGVTSVQVPEGSALKTVVIEPNADGSLPAIGDLANLHGCNFVVDDACAKRFIAQHIDALGASTGNTVTVSSLPGEKMSVDQGVVSSGSTVWSVSDTGSSWVEVGDLGSGVATTFRARCFEDDPSAFTLVLSGAGAYAFDDGCFDNSSIETIVCATQTQLNDVNRRLAEMGRADDITTTLIETTDDGYTYYHVPADGYGRADADGNIVALLKAPSTIRSFDGTFVDNHGDTVKPELIASWAFMGCDQLEWVETSDETWYIGAEAFKGCSAIQGMFLGYADTLNVEPNAFADCPRMKFLAARSMDGEFADECEPNATCAMYAPTGAEGYYQRFTSFTVESNVVDYSLVHQSGDNGFILCGDGAAGNVWIVLAAGSELNGEIELPQDTIEIFGSAFSNVQGKFTINWHDLYQLQWLDQGCFYASGVSGEVYLGDSWSNFVNVADNAFEYCDYITSLTSDALAFNLGANSFGECFSLKRVKLAAGRDYSFGCAFSASPFYECPELTEIEFTNENPTKLLLPATGFPYTFDGWVSPDEDAERIRIKVPEGAEESYIQAWGYLFAGYSGYDDLFEAVRTDIINDTLKTPSDSEVKAEVSERLLPVENRLRKMLGIPSVERSTIFSSSENGGVTLDTNFGVTTVAGVPADAEVIDLSKAIPDDVDGVTIPYGAFQSCTKLKRIILGTKVSQIETGAFTGCDGVEAVLPEIPAGADAPSIALTGGDDWNPFEFGADVKLTVSDTSVPVYLKAWTHQMLGIDDEDSLATFIHIQFWMVDDQEDDVATRKEHLENATNSTFKACENRLRDMMGLDEVEDYHDLASFVATDDYFEKFRSEDEGSDLPELPELPDDDGGSGGAEGSGGADSDDAVGDEAQGDKEADDDDRVDAGAASGQLAQQTLANRVENPRGKGDGDGE